MLFMINCNSKKNNFSTYCVMACSVFGNAWCSNDFFYFKFIYLLLYFYPETNLVND